MKNKKGFTLVELIVCFSLITIVSLGFFKTILSLQQEQLKNIAKNNFKSFSLLLNNSIQKDFMNDRIEKVISCGDNCYDITYTTKGIKRLSIDTTNNYIIYGDIKEKIPKDYKIIGKIEFTNYISEIDGMDSYISLNMNLKSNYDNKIENIKYIYQYDMSNGVIELDVDGAKASDIIEYLLYFSPEENGLYEPLLPDGTSTGIRYRGENPNNYVYFNCEDNDSSNISYGEDNYNYKDSCEVWRIIGVFEVDDGEGKLEKRVKIINTASTFMASWDSSASTINNGYGINQWGESENYKGSDLMQLLNGYYTGFPNSECTYCNTYRQEKCNNICTMESLKSKNMKVLTSNAKQMIEKAVWNTYAVNIALHPIRQNNANDAYLQEKGISTNYTGKLCSNITENCNDNEERTVKWNGLVGLMYISDIGYADGWLYNGTTWPWTITALYTGNHSNFSWSTSKTGSSYTETYRPLAIWPSLYLKHEVTFIGEGNGTKQSPYILGINE